MCNNNASMVAIRWTRFSLTIQDLTIGSHNYFKYDYIIILNTYLSLPNKDWPNNIIKFIMSYIKYFYVKLKLM